ncbi:MAG: hypothetical protein V3U96_01305 [Paracoccaceae bacterium]
MAKKSKIIFALAATVIVAIPATAFWFRNAEVGQHWLERQIEITSHKLLVKARSEAPSAVFVTDGCSGGMSAIWNELSVQFPALKQEVGGSLPWEHCCVAHDRSYYNAGGTETAVASFDARVSADQALRNCVADIGVTQPDKAAEFVVLANGIYTAVRLAGAPCSGLSWRWGFGLPNCYLGHEFLEKNQP